NQRLIDYDLVELCFHSRDDLVERIAEREVGAVSLKEGTANRRPRRPVKNQLPSKDADAVGYIAQLSIGDTGVGDGSASAAPVGSLTCDGGGSTMDAAPLVVAVPGVVLVPVVPPNIRAPTRFGSVHSKVPAGVMCGSACARISMMTPFVRLISCSALRRAGLRCSDVRIA